MRHYAGLDVSLEETAICVVDEAGRIVKAGPRRDPARSERTGGAGQLLPGSRPEGGADRPGGMLSIRLAA